MYGQWGGEASDLDVTDPEAGSSFPKDPSPEEIQFLASTTNLSPNCYPGARCTDIDLDLLRQVDADYVLTLGYRHTVRYIEQFIPEIEDIVGKPVIYIELSQTGPQCNPGQEDRCYGKSMIDLIKQLEDLALALGVKQPATVDLDKQALCQASADFQDAARTAHLRGVRVMAAYLVPGEESSSYYANPPDDMVLRMFEELGLPLLHVQCDLAPDQQSCPLGFFWETIANKNFTNYQGGVGKPKYPVDFWLYDDRTTLTVLDPAFATQGFPDRAFQLRQYAYWPIGGGTLSYRHAAEILNIVTPSLVSAQRIHDATNCVPGVDVSGIAHRTVGLDGGEFACYDESYHRTEYLHCPAPDTGSQLSTPTLIGIVVGGVVGLLLLAFVCFRARKQSSKEMDTGSKQTNEDRSSAVESVVY